MSEKFWEEKSLSEMTTEEWESLCDGCGRCCLNKLEDEDSGEIYFTNVACRLFDNDKCACSDYANRMNSMPDCMILSSDNVEALAVMPSTCAYSLLWRKKPLPDWHPLVSGNKQSVIDAGMTVSGKVVSEEHIHFEQLPEHLINWISVK